MNLIHHCDWLRGIPAVSRKKKFPKSLMLNLLTKLVRSRWLDIGLVLFCEFMDAKKELGQYPAILTSRLVNNPHILHMLFLSHLMTICSRSHLLPTSLYSFSLILSGWIWFSRRELTWSPVFLLAPHMICSGIV